MRLFTGLCAAPPLLLLGLACNTVSPDQCWPNTSGGLGGSEPIPIGAGVGATTGGDYLTPPRRPLDSGDEPNPCMVQESPCVQKCNDDYETAAIACGKITDAAQSHACSEAARQVYKSCVASCRQMSKTCTDMYVACKDIKRMPCNRDIDSGYSICAHCRDDCQANRPYKFSDCYKCGFE